MYRLLSVLDNMWLAQYNHLEKQRSDQPAFYIMKVKEGNQTHAG